MIGRVENGVTFTQSYNSENRLATVRKLATGNCAAPGQIAMQWDFAYDGDGTRVKQVVSTYDQSTPQNITGVLVTAYFMGGAYEVTTDGNGATVGMKKYYSIAGMTVAMNDGNGLQYLLTDHLGSVVAITNASGTLTSQQRYLPFGQVRTDTPSIPNSPITQTDFGYTGQRSLSMGLYDYHARFYDSYITHFSQPDSIIPQPSNPQSLNRYSYVNNRPINLNDPTGHIGCYGENADDGPQCYKDGIINNKGHNQPMGPKSKYYRQSGANLSTIVPNGPACGPIACTQPSPSNVCPIGQTCYMQGNPSRGNSDYWHEYADHIKSLLYGLDVFTALRDGARLISPGERSIDPNPVTDAIVGGSLQGVSDLGNASLTLPQRGGRDLVAGFESGINGLISLGPTVAGGATGGPLGALAGHITTTLLIDNLFKQVNTNLFPEYGLGDYP